MLRAKDVEFDVTYINLREKPDWFLKISPHGKVPVLLVDEVPLFESNAIAEFLDEMVAPQLHPADPIKRARNRAWTDYITTFAGALGSVNYSKSEEAKVEAIAKAATPLQRVELAIASERGNDGPYFNGSELCLVDAAYAPFLQRFAFVDNILSTGLLKDYPLISAWSKALLSNAIVTGAVAPEFTAEFEANLERRGTYAWDLMQKSAAAE
jgi:glutathione S-transferase